MDTGRSKENFDRPEPKSSRLVLYVVSFFLILLGLGLWWHWFSPPGLTHIPVLQTIANSKTADPVQINIPKLGISASMEKMGLNQDGSLAVPAKWNDVGWYAAGTKPGDVGPAVLVGHLDSYTGPAVFWNLRKLQAGDDIEIQRADGTQVSFRVTSLEHYDQNNFPTQKVYGPTATPSLRLITCSGNYNRLLGHYSQNLVVYAELK